MPTLSEMQNMGLEDVDFMSRDMSRITGAIKENCGANAMLITLIIYKYSPGASRTLATTSIQNTREPIYLFEN